MNTRTGLLLRGLALVGLPFSTTVCAPPAEPGPEPPVEGVELSLTTVPTGAQCVRVVATIGTQTVTPPLITVAPGASSAALSLGRLPAGAATFNASAFDTACAMVIAASTPSWIADPAMATLGPGILTTVSLTFRKNNAVTVSANFLDNVVEIATGGAATYARMGDGSVKQWGFTPAGPSTSPVPVPGFTGAVQLTAGGAFACARKADGTVWCWGQNGSGQLGPSVAINATVTTPVQVPLSAPATDIAAGADHVCAVLFNSAVCWGDNSSGQLGNGTTTRSATPVASAPAAGRIFAGVRHTCAINGGGRVSCWGDNTSGQIGDGTTVNRLLPVQLNGTLVLDAVEMALGLAHTCVIRGDGQMSCWGDNGFGELGDGTFVSHLTPVTVPTIPDAVMAVAGNLHTCTLRRSGGVFCSGFGPVLGDGLGDFKSTPGMVVGLGNALAVRSKVGNHACAEMSDRTVQCWGENNLGQIGDGTTRVATKPTPVKLQ